jgi:hypothetical protein
MHRRKMPLLSCHGPGTTETYGGADFLLAGFCCRFSAAECRGAAVACGADWALFFLIEDTIYFGVNFNRFGNSGHENCLIASR